MHPNPNSPQPGDRVGEYVLTGFVGSGRFGVVWRARHHVWHDRVFAVKVPTDPRYLRLLNHEGRVLHGLDHPNVVRALSLDPYADVPYLVTEYVHGSSLRPLISGGRERRSMVSDPAVALAILERVLVALDHAHGRGVVHRDVKPENVLLDARVGAEGYDAPGLVKLGDFGLGRVSSDSQLAQPQSTLMSGSTWGADDRLAGTPGYVAPEVLEGQAADAAADLYAAGVLLFEMLTGRRPAGAASLASLPTPLASRMDDLFRRAYASRDQRFVSAADMLEALRSIRCAAKSASAVPPAQPAAARAPPTTRTPPPRQKPPSGRQWLDGPKRPPPRTPTTRQSGLPPRPYASVHGPSGARLTPVRRPPGPRRSASGPRVRRPRPSGSAPRRIGKVPAKRPRRRNAVGGLSASRRPPARQGPPGIARGVNPVERNRLRPLPRYLPSSARRTGPAPRDAVA